MLARETEHYDRRRRLRLPAPLAKLVYHMPLGKVGRYRVWAVDGRAVRDRIDVDFTTGGNGGRYRYVPASELWIERVLEPADAACSLLHEAVEADLMIRRGQSYDQAHEAASKAEMPLRRALQGRRLSAGEMVPTVRAVYRSKRHGR